MKTQVVTVATLLATVGAGSGLAQSPDVTVEALQSSAKQLAGLDWTGTYMRLCIPGAADMISPSVNPADYPDLELPRLPDGTRPAANWVAEPQQVGQNFYWIGERLHNSWALVAETGEIIIIDGLYAYATEKEIFDGLRKLGLDPADVRYQLFAHAHGDHDGGAYDTEQKYPWITLIYGAGDWPAVMARGGDHATRKGPENDGVTGREITLGDTSVEIVETPGHTPGTLSFLFEYRDLDGVPRRVAYSGGTAISFTNEDPAYYDTYIESVQKFARLAADYGAEVLLSNHSEFDSAYYKANVVANRDSTTEYDPFVVGQRDVLDYLGTIELCAKAAKLRATGSL